MRAGAQEDNPLRRSRSALRCSSAAGAPSRSLKLESQSTTSVECKTTLKSSGVSLEMVGERLVGGAEGGCVLSKLAAGGGRTFTIDPKTSLGSVGGGGVGLGGWGTCVRARERVVIRVGTGNEPRFFGEKPRFRGVGANCVVVCWCLGEVVGEVVGRKFGVDDRECSWVDLVEGFVLVILL